jgi:hypothetical protein
MTKYLISWAGIWLVVAAGFYIFVGKEEPEVLYGIAMAALISLFFLVKTLNDQWEGEIIELKTEEVYVSDDDDGGHTEKQLKAIVRFPNGKTKKISAQNGYVVGKYLVKKRGETGVECLDAKPS